MHEPDRFEKGLRFGCGFLFGIVVGLFLLIKYIDLSPRSLILILLCSALCCGWLAMRYGDEFWYNLRDWWQ